MIHHLLQAIAIHLITVPTRVVGLLCFLYNATTTDSALSALCSLSALSLSLIPREVVYSTNEMSLLKSLEVV